MSCIYKLCYLMKDAIQTPQKKQPNIQQSISIKKKILKFKPLEDINNHHINNTKFLLTKWEHLTLKGKTILGQLNPKNHYLKKKKKYCTHNRLTNTLVMLRLFVCIQASHLPSCLFNRRQLLIGLFSFLDFLTDLLIDISSILDVATLTWFETNFEIPKFQAHTIDDLLAPNSKHPVYDILNCAQLTKLSTLRVFGNL